jgi:hypothetical protein
MNSGARTPKVGIVGRHAAVLIACLHLASCATPAQNIGLAAAAITGYGGQAPTTSIEVIYYLGVFDPQDQLPPTVYRVRVQGQGSFISQAKFASGWVRAELIDSLSTGGTFTNTGISIDTANSLEAAKLVTGRRLVMFGPEGFREAPKDHRLVIVMGSNPAGFFQAMDQSLSVITNAQAAKQNSDLVNKLFATLSQLKGEGDRISDLSKTVAETFPASP